MLNERVCTIMHDFYAVVAVMGLSVRAFIPHAVGWVFE